MPLLSSGDSIGGMGSPFWRVRFYAGSISRRHFVLTTVRTGISHLVAYDQYGAPASYDQVVLIDLIRELPASPCVSFMAGFMLVFFFDIQMRTVSPSALIFIWLRSHVGSVFAFLIF